MTWNEAEITRAEQTIKRLFSVEPYSTNKFVVKCKCEKFKTFWHIDSCVLPALVSAHSLYGDALPDSLVRRLRNPDETGSSLFELQCLCVLLKLGEVEPEPTLPSGKIPDFKVTLTTDEVLYVECKQSNPFDGDAKAIARFKKGEAVIREAFESSEILKEAHDKDLRLEILVDTPPTKTVLAKMMDALQTTRPKDLIKNPLELADCLRVECKKASDPMLMTSSIKGGIGRVPTEPIPVTAMNGYCVGSWKAIDGYIMKSQGQRLNEAMHQLNGIPSNATGVVIMDVVSSRKFADKIKGYIDIREYDSVKIVWLNPFTSGKMVFRDDGKEIAHKISRILKTS